jgi:heme exporter protein D
LRNFDFSSWQAILSTLLGLVFITLLGVGLRLMVMQTIQQRRQRENRQINERLRTLIGAYKTLGGSFTGRLAVDPTHLGDLRRRGAGGEVEVAGELAVATAGVQGAGGGGSGSDRSRRIRDAVEAALSDILLLGTDEQVRLAAHAAAELAAGRPVRTDELVVSLRDFIRRVLDLEPIPSDLAIPLQGPTRPSSSSGKGKGEGSGREGSGSGGGQGPGGGMAAGGGYALGGRLADDRDPLA